jgi:hypothetical protein
MLCLTAMNDTKYLSQTKEPNKLGCLHLTIILQWPVLYKFYNGKVRFSLQHTLLS